MSDTEGVQDRHHDLVIIGSGSANSILSPEFADLDVGMVEGGTFGGTCLNVGCIPTKMYVHPADLAASVTHAADVDVDLRRVGVDWASLRDRVFDRIDPIAAGGKAWRAGPENPNVTLYTGFGHFVGPKRFDTGTGVVVTADRFVIGAGGRATVPTVPGLVLGERIHTSDTIMRIDALPSSIIIVGGGYVAAEFGHVFAGFGTEVTQVVRGDRLLRGHDADVAAALLAATERRAEVLLDTVPTEFAVDDEGVTMTFAGGRRRADVVLVAAGRVPNGDRLGLDAAGVDLDADGYIEVDEFQQTSAAGIFALGDVSSHHQLKHVANHEMRVVQHNLLHPEAMIASDHRFVPSAVFTEPQIASVGLTVDEAEAAGVDFVVARFDYAGIAAGWAREDTTGFLKVLADPATGLLLGAHVIGPEAAVVIQPLIQAMHFGQTAHEVARGQYWIHPALSEIVENALLALPEPTSKG